MNGYLNAIILSIHHLIVGDEVINLEHLKQDAESAIKRDKEKDAELEKLRAQVAQAPVVEWISVEDRLPEIGDEVVAVLEWFTSKKKVHGVVKRVEAGDHDWELDGSELSNSVNVTHWMPLWMPLPEPPKESKS